MILRPGCQANSTGDIRGAIRLAASDDIMSPFDDVTAAKLREKHPIRAKTDSTPLPPSSENCIAVLESDILGAIQSFMPGSGSAGGPDGLRPQHLKDLTCASTGDAGRRLLTLLTQFTNLCLAGRVPAEIHPVFCGASLCTLNKKDGGIRPIAVGSTLRRLIAKTACKAVTVKMADRFLPVQLGFGVPRATESAVYAARQYLSKLQRGYGLLKLDFSNAFNSIRRDVMFASVLREMPELYPFCSHVLQQRIIAQLWWIPAAVRGRCTTGRYAWSSTFLCFYYGSSEKHDVRAEHLVYGWRHNRWTTQWSSSRSRYSRTHRTNTGIAAQWGQVWNCHQRSRCNLQIQSIRHSSCSGAILLGAPIGDISAIDTVLTNKLTDFQRLASRLTTLGAHDALFLLQNCFGMPKLLYTLRSAPCHQSSILMQYDTVIRQTLILNLDLTESVWNQATLPVSRGGFACFSFFCCRSLDFNSASPTKSLTRYFWATRHFLHHVKYRMANTML